MKEGHEYVFEKIDKNYSIKEDDSKNRYLTEKKVIKLEVEKVIPNERIIITLCFLENFRDGTARKTAINRIDYFYPDFTRLSSESGFIESILSRSKLRFSINLETNEIKLLNKVELLEEFYLRLKEQGNDDKGVDSFIENIIKRKLFIENDLISFLIWFQNIKITSEETIENSRFEDKFIVRERQGNFVNFGDQEFDKIIPGREFKKYWINLENGIIINYSTIQFDSIKSSYDRRVNKNKWRVQEKNFRLLYSQKIPENKLFISGKIENPLSDKIHIRILDKPFGYNLKTKTIILDNNGTFNTSLDFSHEGFVYVENENRNKHNPPGTYVFYSEPGDTINFESTGNELPWNTTVYGTRRNEANYIQELRNEIKVHEISRLSSWSNKILDREIVFGVSIVDGKPIAIGNIYPLFNALETVDQISTKYKSEISEKAFNFITNETKAYLYNGIFNFGWNIIRSDDLSLEEFSGTENYSVLLPKIDSLDFHEVYNDYGFHSRKCVNRYLNYHFSKANKTKRRYFTSYGFRYSSDPELEIQASRMVLTGSPLYREIAQTLNEIIIKKTSKSSSNNRDDYLNRLVNENFDLMIRLCNDMELVNEVKYIISQQEKLAHVKFVPSIDFVDRNNKKVSFDNFKGNKPSIFYFSPSWSGDRYIYDDLVKENPEINFIMVVEGSNFKQWEEYTSAAEPEAIHLLYMNDKASFEDIFQKSSLYLVFNKNGKFEGNARGTKSAIQKAKSSLISKKQQLDKSQLQIVVLVLVSLLSILIIALFIWKWKVRQRFRKEAQIRKLRELELTAIRSQMNPHFLFNSLNSVQNLVQQNKGREAHLYLADFAGLIRKVLRNSEKEEVSLAEELEMVEQYLNLEKLRFDFDFSISVDKGIDPHNTLVPSMLFQPFAENAVIHGLQSKVGNRQLKIDILKENTGIKISIEDNGIGREEAKKIAKAKNGKGSKLIQERLKILQEKQGEKYGLEIIDLTGDKTGTRVEIFIPEEK